MNSKPFSRRELIQGAGVCATSMAFAAAVEAQESVVRAKPGVTNNVQLSQIHGPSEQEERTPGPYLPPGQRVGFAIVGLGRLSLNQILPAFGSSLYCKPTALVSGDRAKAERIAAQYGIPNRSIYSYSEFEELAGNKDVQAVYIVLPNSMHEEYVVRAAKAGKHILCEKPMATSSAEARRMIDACAAARVKLMIAYRQQYEPHNRALRELVTAGKLGRLRSFVASNSQQQGDPTQWRLKKALAGGGCLPDVGLYCLNAARFLSGEEPSRVTAQLWQPKDDPRFREVEASVSFSLHFESGFSATCSTSYDVHKSQFLRLEGTDAWGEMRPAFAYHGNKLTVSKLEDGVETLVEPGLEEKDQFALEMDHFAECLLEDKVPHTPGDEGLQDHKIMEAIYESARTGTTVDIAGLSAHPRGPDLVKRQ